MSAGPINNSSPHPLNELNNIPQSEDHLAPNPELAEVAGVTDNCALDLLASFDLGLDDSTANILVRAVEEQATAETQQAATSEELAVQREQVSAQREELGAESEHAAKASEAVSLIERLEAKDAIESIFLGMSIDIEAGSVTVVKATASSASDMKQAVIDKLAFVLHGNEIGVHESLGWANGKTITIVHDGVSREVKVRTLSSSEYEKVSTVVTNFVLQLPKEIKREKEAEKAPERRHTTDKHQKEVAHLPKHKHVDRPRVDYKDTIDTRELRKISELKFEEAKTDASRKHAQSAHKLELLIVKQLVVRSTEDKKFEEQAHLFLDGLANGAHFVSTILRSFIKTSA